MYFKPHFSNTFCEAIFFGCVKPIIFLRPRVSNSKANEALAVITSYSIHYTKLYEVLLPKAIEFTNEVRSFGAALLAALEKKDSEGLAIGQDGKYGHCCAGKPERPVKKGRGQPQGNDLHRTGDKPDLCRQIRIISGKYARPLIGEGMEQSCKSRITSYNVCYTKLLRAMETLTLVQTGKRDPIPLILLDPPGSTYSYNFV